MFSAEVVLFIDNQHLKAQGQKLSEKFHLLLVNEYPENQFVLVLNQEGLALHLPDSKQKPIYVDFQSTSTIQRFQKSRGRHELIARAVGIKGEYFPSIIDATAGLGGDSIVLAHLGCSVQMVERSPVIVALLEDGLKRVQSFQLDWVSRVNLVWDDAKNFLLKYISSGQLIDVVYLDPMFPERIKSALVKKEMRALKEIVGNDNDAGELFNLAKQCAQKRVVVKRPRYAQTLTKEKPSVVYQGKACRFDVYLVPAAEPKP